MTASIDGTPFVIRRATPDDAPELASLADKLFRDTFGPDNTPEDMDEHCRSSFSPAIQREQIVDPQMVTLVAIDAAGHLSAYVQLRPGSPAHGSIPAPIELWRFYVDAAHHGRGLAYQLMDATLDAAAQHGAKSIWLSVWERNERAQRFYGRVGFDDIGATTFTLGSDVQSDRVMARPIG